MNRKFLLTLLSSPVLFTSVITTVMIAQPIHASPTITPGKTRLSCVRSPHSPTTGKQVCVQIPNISSPPKSESIVIASSQPDQSETDEFVMTDAESDEAIQLFGCDCPVCIRAVRQLHGLAPQPL